MATLIDRINDVVGMISSQFKNRTGIEIFVGGKPAANELLFHGRAPYSFTPTVGACYGNCGTPSSVSANFMVFRNGTQIAAVAFFPGQTAAGAFTFNSPAIAKGDIITIRAPSTQDATLADVKIELRP